MASPVGQVIRSGAIGAGIFGSEQLGTQLGIEVTFEPNPTIIASKFYELDAQIRSFKVPLQRSIQEVVAPSFDRNFQVGGRPPWIPLSDITINRKAREGSRYVSEPLKRTGLLNRVAKQLNIWKIDGPRGLAYIDSLGRASYGVYHQSGEDDAFSTRAPARPWAVLQRQDVAQIEEVFGFWLDERIAASGVVD